MNKIAYYAGYMAKASNQNGPLGQMSPYDANKFLDDAGIQNWNKAGMTNSYHFPNTTMGDNLTLGNSLLKAAPTYGSGKPGSVNIDDIKTYVQNNPKAMQKTLTNAGSNTTIKTPSPMR